MKKFITLTLALMLALTVFSLSTIAEVQKYGDILLRLFIRTLVKLR